jgi:hypothetical protein
MKSIKPLYKKGASRFDLFFRWKSNILNLGDDPSEEVRNYFGEELGFYFKWVQFFSRWIKLASFVGLSFFGYGMYQALISEEDMISRFYLLIDNNSIVFLDCSSIYGLMHLI